MLDATEQKALIKSVSEN